MPYGLGRFFVTQLGQHQRTIDGIDQPLAPAAGFCHLDRLLLEKTQRLGRVGILHHLTALDDLRLQPLHPPGIVIRHPGTPTRQCPL